MLLPVIDEETADDSGLFSANKDANSLINNSFIISTKCKRSFNNRFESINCSRFCSFKSATIVLPGT